MTQNLVRYPALDYEAEGGWRDSGEGGQFFYAVWNNAEPAACNVDAAPSLHMADVLVAAHGPLADEFDEQRRAWREASNAGDWDRAWRESGIQFDTVVMLGSTSISYFEDDYFAIKDAGDLTETGQAIVNAVSVASGTEPTFVTYLDT